MLVISRQRNEQVVIDLRKHGLGLIEITAVDIRSSGKVRLGFEAGQNIPINRLEVHQAIEREVNRPPMKICQDCGGTGDNGSLQNCPACNGTGEDGQ